MKIDDAPLVSVITLSFNSPDLYGAIDSVLNQDYPNIEYIILDDGTPSFDKKQVEEYVENHQHGNIVKLVVNKSEKRLGTVKETNKAYNISTGEYLINLAGDDQFEDEKVITDWVNEFKRTGANVLTAYRMVYDENLERALYKMPTEEQVDAIKSFSPKELFEYVEGNNIVFGCCTARTHACVNEVGLLDEKFKLIEDYVLLLRTLRVGKKIDFFDRVVVKYRSGGTCSVNRVNREYLKDNDNIFKFEVLPYSSNKKKAKEKYYNWRKETIWQQHYNQFCSKKNLAGTNLVKLASAYFILSAKHPLKAFNALKRKIKNKLLKK